GYELLGRQEVQELLEVVKEKNPAVVDELVPNLLSHGEVQKVLQNLLKEGVPIRDLVTILEARADRAKFERDIDVLTEAARQALARTISKQYVSDGDKLHVITIHPRLEQEITESLQMTALGNYPVLEPNRMQKLVRRLGEVLQKVNSRGL